MTNPDDSAGNVADGLVWRATKSRKSDTQSMAGNANIAGEFATGSILHNLSIGAEYGWADTRNLNYSVDTGNRSCPPAAIAAFNCTELSNPDPSDPWSGAITPASTPSLSEAEDISIYAFDSATLIPELIVTAGVRYTDYRASGSGAGRGGPFSGSVETDFGSWQAGATHQPVPWARASAAPAAAACSSPASRRQSARAITARRGST